MRNILKVIFGVPPSRKQFYSDRFVRRCWAIVLVWGSATLLYTLPAIISALFIAASVLNLYLAMRSLFPRGNYLQGTVVLNRVHNSDLGWEIIDRFDGYLMITPREKKFDLLRARMQIMLSSRRFPPQIGSLLKVERAMTKALKRALSVRSADCHVAMGMQSQYMGDFRITMLPVNSIHVQFTIWFRTTADAVAFRLQHADDITFRSDK